MLLRIIFVTLFLIPFYSQNVMGRDLTKKPIKLILRANIYDGFRLNAPAFLGNETPIIDNNGNVGIVVLNEGGTLRQSLFIGDENDGQTVYQSEDNVFLSNLHQVGPKQYVLSSSDSKDTLEVFKISPGREISLFENDFSTPPLIFNGIQYLNEESFIARRLMDGKRELILKSSDSEKVILTEQENGVAYIFRPVGVANGKFVVKVRYGSISNTSGDKLLYYNGKKFLTVSDSSSLWAEIRNTAHLTTSGEIYFVAKSSKDQRYRLVKYSHGKTEILITEGIELKGIDYFRPIGNERGQVAFRGVNFKGERCVYLYDSGVTSSLACEGDLISTDRETGRIDNRPNKIGFSGGVDLNENGEVVFHTLLINKDRKQLGNAVYLYKTK